jgi:hypothetical protein
MTTRRKFGLLLTSAAFVGVINLGYAPHDPKPTRDRGIQAQTEVKPAEREPDVVYVPTAYEVVEQMLELANVTKDDMLYDLGSGDGRIPITAAQKYGTRGVGIDINPERIQEANENARKARVTDLVKFLQQDLFTSDFSSATVVTLYLLPELNLKLRPELFRQLKPGTRVVSNAFDMGDWKPDRVVKTKGGSTIYLWIIPEKIPANLLSN